MYVLLHYNFEAIHNKDYSVVKTFRAAFGSSCLFFGEVSSMVRIIGSRSVPFSSYLAPEYLIFFLNFVCFYPVRYLK